MNRMSDKHIIARRNLRAVSEIGAKWREEPGAAMTLRQARDAYDRGEVIMCQRTEDGWAIQYAKRRAEVEKGKAPWFSWTERFE